jgi:hypothetical protein
LGDNQVGEETYIIECITPDRREEDSVIRSTAWLRTMVGPFPSFDAAHTWMTHVGSKGFDTLIIHTLRDPEKVTHDVLHHH